MRYRAVLFDLDGTLVDSIPDIAQAVNHMLEEMGHPTLSPQKI
ncbi:MAG: HAD hydrolase-like protein, partial [Alcaligenaceae bacterium]|nr:HAD hydrolase-like protein [Alcaligenaceae bacterium]